MYLVEYEDQYGNVTRYSSLYPDLEYATAVAERLWNLRHDYPRISVIDDKTEEVVCDYEH